MLSPLYVEYLSQGKPQSRCGIVPEGSLVEGPGRIEGPGRDEFTPEEIERLAEKTAYVIGLLPIPLPSIAAPLFDRLIRNSARWFWRGTRKSDAFALIASTVYSSPIIWMVAGDNISGIIIELISELQETWIWVFPMM